MSGGFTCPLDCSQGGDRVSACRSLPPKMSSDRIRELGLLLVFDQPGGGHFPSGGQILPLPLRPAFVQATAETMLAAPCFIVLDVSKPRDWRCCRNACSCSSSTGLKIPLVRFRAISSGNEETRAVDVEPVFARGQRPDVRGTSTSSVRVEVCPLRFPFIPECEKRFLVESNDTESGVRFAQTWSATFNPSCLAHSA